MTKNKHQVMDYAVDCYGSYWGSQVCDENKLPGNSVPKILIDVKKEIIPKDFFKITFEECVSPILNLIKRLGSQPSMERSCSYFRYKMFNTFLPKKYKLEPNVLLYSVIPSLDYSKGTLKEFKSKYQNLLEVQHSQTNTGVYSIRFFDRNAYLLIDHSLRLMFLSVIFKTDIGLFTKEERATFFPYIHQLRADYVKSSGERIAAQIYDGLVTYSESRETGLNWNTQVEIGRFIGTKLGSFSVEKNFQTGIVSLLDWNNRNILRNYLNFELFFSDFIENSFYYDPNYCISYPNQTLILKTNSRSVYD